MEAVAEKYVIVSLCDKTAEEAAALDNLAFKHGASYVIGKSNTGLKSWPPAGEKLERVRYRSGQEIETRLTELRDKVDWILLEPLDPKIGA